MISYLRGWYLLNFGLFGFLSCQEQSLIHVQHPELPRYYDDISSSNPVSEYGRVLRTLRRREKIAKCHQTLNAVIYRSLTSDQTLSPPSNPNIEDLLRDVKDLHYRQIISGIQLIEVTLQLPQRIVLVPALPCILHVNFFWFITPGFQQDEYFILEKEATDENFYLHGIVEPRPIINEVISYDQLLIEVHFLKHYRSTEPVYSTLKPVHITPGPVYITLKSVHIAPNRFITFQDELKAIRYRVNWEELTMTLDTLQALRLCSSAHVVWRDVARKHPYQANSAYDDANLCIENAVVSFEKITQENTGFSEPIRIDLLSCAINTPRTDSQFYLAADQNVLDAAYLFLDYRNDNDEVVYRPFIHLGDIPLLRKERKMVRTYHEHERGGAVLTG